MYVDAYLDKQKEIIHVAERHNGKRIFKQYPAQYVFYYPDPNGRHTSIFGDKLNKVVCNSSKQFAYEKKVHSDKRLFESDTNPIFRCLSDNYKDAGAPDLNIGYFDIETAFSKEFGFSTPEAAFNPITSIALHISSLKMTVCLVVKPEGMEVQEADNIVNEFPNGTVFRFDTEEEMLKSFLDLIQDVDVLTGWNSTSFDIPYTVNRVAKLLSKDYLTKFCLWGQKPRARTFERYGKDQHTFDLTGIQHLDYFELYRKYTYHEMHSYSLDAISEYELDEKKVPYEGTLDDLYNNDFKKFIEYNLQDVDLIVKLDKKLQFIDLANVIAHENLVLLQTTMGSVAQIDQAIINEAHELGLIIPDRQRSGKGSSVAGAYVAYPKKGLHEWIGSMDLNSLYPSIIRALNMSTETLVGQVRQTYTEAYLEDCVTNKKMSLAEAWENHFGSLEYDLIMQKDRELELHIDFEDGSSISGTGAEFYRIIFEERNNWIISANGTLFTTEKSGVIPGILDKWYSSRKELQKKAKSFKGVQTGIKIDENFAEELRKSLNA